MATCTLFPSSATSKSAFVFLPKVKTGLVCILIMVIVGCQSQTFQYSRGWTNGKRSEAGNSNNNNNGVGVGFRAGDWSQRSQLFDVDNGVVGPLEDSAVPVPPSVHMNLGRPSLDYNPEIGEPKAATTPALDRNSDGTIRSEAKDLLEE